MTLGAIAILVIIAAIVGFNIGRSDSHASPIDDTRWPDHPYRSDDLPRRK